MISPGLGLRDRIAGSLIERLNNEILCWDLRVEDRGWPDWAYAPEWGLLQRLCGLLRAHQAVDDQLEHRQCRRCYRPMPNVRGQS